MIGLTFKKCLTIQEATFNIFRAEYRNWKRLSMKILMEEYSEILMESLFNSEITCLET